MSTYDDTSDREDTTGNDTLADVTQSNDAADIDDVTMLYEEDQGPAGIKRLREKLTQAVKEKQEYLDGWQRAKADFMNYKKDQDALHGKIKEAGKESMIHDLLSVADSFEMAFANKESWEKVDENWRRGVEYIYAQFGKVLDDHGITVIDPRGERFDPARHSAAEAVPTDDPAKDDIVITVVQKGYVMNGKVLRPARVRVGQYSG